MDPIFYFISTKIGHFFVTATRELNHEIQSWLGRVNRRKTSELQNGKMKNSFYFTASSWKNKQQRNVKYPTLFEGSLLGNLLRNLGLNEDQLAKYVSSLMLPLLSRFFLFFQDASYSSQLWNFKILSIFQDILSSLLYYIILYVTVGYSGKFLNLNKLSVFVCFALIHLWILCL